MNLILNIGLIRSTVTANGEAIDVDHALAVTNGYGIAIESWTVADSDSEPTLIATATGESWEAVQQQVDQIATELAQDCIAVYDQTSGRGELIGRLAQLWGPFNPAYFLLPNGDRLGREAATA